MSGYRAADRGEIRKHTFRARFVRRDMVALVAILLTTITTGALVMPPKTDVHCLQLSRTCTVDRVYLGVAPFHDLLDLQGAVGPARVAGVGKHRYVAVQMEGGGERALGQFGPERDLVVEALTAFCLTGRDTDAAHDGTLPIVLFLLGLVASGLVALGFVRERLEVTLESNGQRLQVSVARKWRRTRTLDFDLHELGAFEGHLETRRSGKRGTTVYFRLEARLLRQHEEVLPEQVDHPALHVLTSQLNHFLDTLPERRLGRG